MGKPEKFSKNRFGISIINIPVSPMNEEAVFETGPLGYGHKAVTKAIMRGLKAIGCPFNFNPSSEKDIYSTGFFTYQIECDLHLRQLLDLRQKGLINQLFGFCIVDHSFYETYYDELDVFFTLTPWLFRAKDVSCPVSCDMSLFQRSTPIQDQQAVTVYYKNRDGNEAIADALEPTKAFLEKKNIPYHLLEYGFGDSGYSYQQLIEALNTSYAMIVLDTWETQGIFLHESWSMDVPTFILDV
ncbi:MAG: hypothetical protein K2X66_02940, partial [Cyanobacteria bacterium]|nr:hypothetical protein [Cyanobacteriota bacterium]